LILLFFIALFDYKNKTNIIKAIFLVVFFSMLQILPTQFEWNADIEAKQNVNQKSPSDSEIYALKIRHLLIPINDHPLKYFADFSKRNEVIHFPLENENSTAKLGLFASIGFIILLVYALYNIYPRFKRNYLFIDDNLQASSFLLLVILLFFI
jgi:hypothetical protein